MDESPRIGFLGDFAGYLGMLFGGYAQPIVTLCGLYLCRENKQAI